MNLPHVRATLRRWKLRRSSRPGEGARRWLRRFFVVAAVSLLVPMFFAGRADGQAHVPRGGTVGIRTPAERDLFFSLICQCGCPRETLGTCTCDYAGERRDEIRDQLDSGMSVTAVRKEYARRFGTKALAVPPNEGAGLLIWLFPLVGIVLAAFVIARLLKRWTGRGAVLAAAEAPAPETKASKSKAEPAKKDAYDDRLDEELKDLDRE